MTARVFVPQVRLEWPTDLAVNPMDNSLYVLENNVILRITENHQVCNTRLDHRSKPPKGGHSLQGSDKIFSQLVSSQPI